MAEIRYFYRPGGSPRAESDQISDAALDRYTPPVRKYEYAVATLANGRKKYGYDGEWHDNPPADVLAHEWDQAQRQQKREEDQAINAVGAISFRVSKWGVQLPGSTDWLSWADLREAAEQPDRVGRVVYRSILQAAESVHRWPYESVRDGRVVVAD